MTTKLTTLSTPPKSAFFSQYGPGIIMASSCVGGSHIIASTQAGVYYGWQLAGLIVLVNALKYPFFRLAFDYANQNDKTLLAGYAERGRGYLMLFLVFNMFATVVNVAGGTLLSAVLLGMMMGQGVPLPMLNVIIMISFVWLIFGKQYQKLDHISKFIMLALSVITLVALVMVMANPTPSAPVSPPSPWVWSAVPFLVALMGWMPAPMELSVSSSLWIAEKNKINPDYKHRYRRDFNVSYAVSVVLALMFMALGAMVAIGDGEPLQGGKFVGEFVGMYAHAIGEWTRLPMLFVAFVCIYGTTIVAVDGYSRGNQQAVAILQNRPLDDNTQQKHLRYWTLGSLLMAGVVIGLFGGMVGKMIAFAMTLSFLFAPVFAWLNWGLRHKCSPQPVWVNVLAYVGLLYLVAMVGLYLGSR